MWTAMGGKSDAIQTGAGDVAYAVANQGTKFSPADCGDVESVLSGQPFLVSEFSGANDQEMNGNLYSPSTQISSVGGQGPGWYGSARLFTSTDSAKAYLSELRAVVPRCSTYRVAFSAKGSTSQATTLTTTVFRVGDLPTVSVGKATVWQYGNVVFDLYPVNSAVDAQADLDAFARILER